MLSFTTSAGRFQVRVAAIVTHEDRVLLHRSPLDSFWALPGGRLEFDEDAGTTVTRELAEELGVASTTGALRFVVESFFVYRDVAYHEIGFYFDAEIEPTAALFRERGDFRGHDGEDDLLFRWFLLDELDDAIIRPAFLVTALRERAPGIVHVVQRDGVKISAR
jgi:ADP-ribose pyrophosphatase YjhB (NUDIX family)